MALIHDKFNVGQRVEITSAAKNIRLRGRVGTISGISEESTTEVVQYIISLDKPLSPPRHFPGLRWSCIVLSGLYLKEYHGPN